MPISCTVVFCIRHWPISIVVTSCQMVSLTDYHWDTAKPLIVLFLLLQAYFKPFKNALVNSLDCSMMFNLIFCVLQHVFFLLIIKRQQLQ